MPQNLQSSKTLTVYKASAGSGKTFRLAVEYIKLLIDNPRAYEGILAVTFTVKATEEMKMRILSQLYGIWKRLPESQPYMNEVTSALGISEEAASERAWTALHQLLHNYHFFRVQTIDSFFQAVLRNLAKELQLNAGLRVGMNTTQVVEEAVDTLVDSSIDNREMMRIIMGYAKDNMADDKNWNIIGQIKKFGETIFSEIYKQNRAKMDRAFADQSFFDTYKKKMRGIIADAEERYKAFGQEGLQRIKDAGLTPDDFNYKSTGPVNYFIRLAAGIYDTKTLIGKRISDGMDDATKWTSKTSKKRDIIISFVTQELLPLISHIEETRSKDDCWTKSARETLRHINDVRLLRSIEETAHSLNDTAQRFMLSDTQSLLHEMIDDSDSAFIFEKIGSRLQHVMIDEFQDTSAVQWANFKPLLHECMSQGFSNLIVGDVKQSIYRFRNGDWRLLNDIDKEFEASELEFPPIKTNRRSDMNVINFNNTFFTIAAKLEAEGVKEYSERKAESLAKAYADVEQDIPEGREPIGMVHIDLLPKDMKEEMPQHTLEIILDLIDIGAKQKDIAILVRDKKYIHAVADYIEKNSDIKVISAEAFKLSASAAVRIIVNAMSLLANSEDQIALAALATDYCVTILDNHGRLSRAMASREDLLTLLPDAFSQNMTALRALSLHDMAEALVRIFAVDSCSREAAYVTTFFDHLQTFSNDMAPVLEDFLKAWDTELADKTIEAASTSGVRIMTIHASKGLEFKHVIIPFCNWGINPPTASLVWSTPHAEPFSDMPLIPLDYRNVNTLEGTIYEDDGYEEHIQNVVDNLNLLYVAMTRAGHSLFILGERGANDTHRSKVISDVIEQLPASINGIDIHIDGQEDETAILSVTYGHCVAKEEKRKTSANVFTPAIEPCTISLCSYKNDIEFRQSSESMRFTQDAIDETDRQRMIRMGTVLHQLFASIRTTADIEPALQRMEFDGSLYSDGITREELTASLKKKFADKQIADWFSDRWRVYNECCIISPDGTEHRPDRVITDGKQTIVIDFKFGSPAKAHHQQVQGYMNLLTQMHMPDIKGYLWYVSNERVVEVKNE